MKLGSALGPDKRSHVSATLDKHSAKISPERARAQYEVSHLPLPVFATSIKACRTAFWLGLVVRDRVGLEASPATGLPPKPEVSYPAAQQEPTR